MSIDPAGLLREQLDLLKQSCDAYDSDRRDAIGSIATTLKTIFLDAPGSPSLLASLKGKFASMVSTNAKPPAGNTGGCWPGLILWDLNLSDSLFHARPRLDTNRAAQRLVAADFWWNSEAIYIRDHHQKIRRRDLVIALAGDDGRAGPAGREWLGDGSGWKAVVRPPSGAMREVIVHGAAPASIRQIAHEALSTKDLNKLAGR